MIPSPLINFIDRISIHSFQSDSVIQAIAVTFGYAPQLVFLGSQIILFMLLGIIFVSLTQKKIPIIPILLLATISIYEFVYVFFSLKLGRYPYDMIPALCIGVTGIALLTTLKKKRIKNEETQSLSTNL